MSQASSASETTYHFGVNKQHDTNLYLDGQLACNEYLDWYKGNHPEHCNWSVPEYEPVTGVCSWEYNTACSNTKGYYSLTIYRLSCIDPKVPELVFTGSSWQWSCVEPLLPPPPPEPEPAVPPIEKMHGGSGDDCLNQVGDN